MTPTTSSKMPPPPDEPGDDASRAPKKPGVATLILHHSITVLILILVLALGVWSYLNFQGTDFFAAIDRDAFEAELHPSLDDAQHRRFSTAIETYGLLNDRYPTHLDDLVEEGLLLPSDLYYPRGPDSWSYERQSDGFLLEPNRTGDPG